MLTYRATTAQPAMSAALWISLKFLDRHTGFQGLIIQNPDMKKQLEFKLPHCLSADALENNQATPIRKQS